MDKKPGAWFYIVSEIAIAGWSPLTEVTMGKGNDSHLPYRTWKANSISVQYLNCKSSNSRQGSANRQLQ